MWVVESTDASVTRALGRALGAVAQGPGTVALVGDLGAGKTCFAQGVAEGLGVEEDVASPTFVLLAEYEGRLPLLHGDAYRLRPGEEADIGLEELLEDWAGLALLEWAERVEAALPADRLVVAFRFAEDPGHPGARRIAASATGPRSAALLADWRAAWEGSVG